MIEQQTINGRPATIGYLDRNFNPVDKESAAIVKLSFDDGETIFLSDPAADMTDEQELESLKNTLAELDDTRAAIAQRISDLEAKTATPLSIREQVAVWAEAVKILDASEPTIRDAIERVIAPMDGLILRNEEASRVTTKLVERIVPLRRTAIKQAFRFVRSRLGNIKITGLSLAAWAKIMLTEDTKAIDTALRLGLIAALDHVAVAAKVVGTHAMQTTGATEITRHKIAHLGRAAIREFQQREKS